MGSVLLRPIRYRLYQSITVTQTHEQFGWTFRGDHARLIDVIITILDRSITKVASSNEKCDENCQLQNFSGSRNVLSSEWQETKAVTLLSGPETGQDETFPLSQNGCSPKCPIYPQNSAYIIAKW